MTTTKGKRLELARNNKNLSQQALAQAAKLSVTTIAKIEADHPKYRNSTQETIDRLASALGVSSAWLQYGDESLGKPQDNERPSEIKGRVKGRPIPVLGKAACGRWEDFSDLDFPVGHADQWMIADTKDPNAFYVIAKGDSMVGGEIFPGDMLMVEPNKEVFNGAKVLARDPDQGLTVKLFYKEGNRIRLQPMNPAYPPLYVEPKEDFRVYRITKKLSDL